MPEFMLICLRLYSVSGRFIRATGETTIPHLPAERLREIVFPFPPRAEQQEICEFVEVLDGQLNAANARAERPRTVVDQLLGGVFG
jgi:restriction endonuclease S subunit